MLIVSTWTSIVQCSSHIANSCILGSGEITFTASHLLTNSDYNCNIPFCQVTLLIQTKREKQSAGCFESRLLTGIILCNNFSLDWLLAPSKESWYVCSIQSWLVLTNQRPASWLMTNKRPVSWLLTNGSPGLHYSIIILHKATLLHHVCTLRTCYNHL